MLKIVICEDNIQYRNTLSEYVESILSANCIPGKLVLVCENASQVRNFMDRQDANVFFLDIKLNSDEDGYELASKINENVRKPYIVFVTEHLEYLLLGYKVRPFDFLPKPVTKVVLESCILNIYKDYLESSEASSNDPGKLRVSTGGKIMLIKKNDIIYIEKFNKISVIHTVNSDITCYESLSNLEKLLLGSGSFVRCHKSYLVNKTYISEIRMNTLDIVFDTGHRCFIGKTYKDALLGK